jgi:prepilin-type processing-associated H-X9-DG protein
MPSITFTDIAQLRTEALSFFLLLFFVSAWVIQRLWNGLRRDFTRLPHLSYGRALSVVGLWGFLFVLVLTMISGARELMTPGAWVKDGITYKLNAAGPEGRAAAAVWSDVTAQRPHRIEALRAALWAYAQTHDGQLPASDRAPEIPASAWETADPSRIRYHYIPGHRAGDNGAVPLAYEPPAFGGARWVLWCDGHVTQISDAELRTALEKGTIAPATRPEAGK